MTSTTIESESNSPATPKTLAPRVFPHAVMFRHQLKEIDHYLDWLSTRKKNPDFMQSMLTSIFNLTQFDLRYTDYPDHMPIVADMHLLLRIHQKATFVGIKVPGYIHCAMSNCIDVLYKILALKSLTQTIDIVDEVDSVRQTLPADMHHLFGKSLPDTAGKCKAKVHHAEQEYRPAPQTYTMDDDEVLIPARKRSRESVRGAESDEEQASDKENRPPPRKRRRFSQQPPILKPGHQLFKVRGPDGVRTYSLPSQGGVPPNGMRPLPPISPGEAVPRSLTANSYRIRTTERSQSEQNANSYFPKDLTDNDHESEAETTILVSKKPSRDAMKLRWEAHMSAEDSLHVHPGSSQHNAASARLEDSHENMATSAAFNVFEDDTAVNFAQYLQKITECPLNTATGSNPPALKTSGSIAFASPFGSESTRYLPQHLQTTQLSPHSTEERDGSGSSKTSSHHEPFSLNRILNTLNPDSPFESRAKPAASLVDLVSAGNDDEGYDQHDQEGQEGQEGQEEREYHEENGRHEGDTDTVVLLKAEVRRLTGIVSKLSKAMGK